MHPDAWPDNREFPEREKGVEGLASTHLGSPVCLSKRRALLFPQLDANRNHYISLPARTSLPPLKMRSPWGVFIFAPKGKSAFHSKTCLRTILSYYPGEYSPGDFVITLCAQTRTILSTLRQSFDTPISYPRLENGFATTSHARRLIASRAGEQAVLAQELPKRPAVFLHRDRSASDISMVRMQNRREKVMLEPPNDTRFHCLKRLVFDSMSVLRQVEVREFNLTPVRKVQWRA